MKRIILIIGCEKYKMITLVTENDLKETVM